ncbi:hypothetical protein Cob_v006103 [Colletotrichum orbiculare MAFF 240422]|uniref:Uncharacterized protein n=1 Tax=Colletotrichum orbiculare (strain 104-T / ATCC 96160 / CBS 514.97 / LARS 414 / MAFF 240422) TaxID=1213857 RepID=A0A484FS92_COLOR|nr:hypothetical protein Cob_v006103 [Colletotrichum orbiculare MAFF 240422]
MIVCKPRVAPQGNPEDVHRQSCLSKTQGIRHWQLPLCVVSIVQHGFRTGPDPSLVHIRQSSSSFPIFNHRRHPNHWLSTILRPPHVLEAQRLLDGMLLGILART